MPVQLPAKAFRRPVDVHRNRLSKAGEGKSSKAIKPLEQLPPGDGLRIWGLFGLLSLRLLSPILDEPLHASRGLLLEPIQRLRRRICLIVILALGKRSQFVQILLQPWGVVWNVNKTVFDRARDGMHPHDLVHSRFVLLDRVHTLTDQFLDQLRSRCLVFDQDCVGAKRLCLLLHGSLQFWITLPLAKDAE